MRRPTKKNSTSPSGLSGPIIALNFWLLYAAFHYFQHLVTVLAIAAILAFFAELPSSIL
jgi:predicted PurR-regulated permease PerM